jgi:hypothetical protein
MLFGHLKYCSYVFGVFIFFVAGHSSRNIGSSMLMLLISIEAWPVTKNFYTSVAVTLAPVWVPTLLSDCVVL